MMLNSMFCILRIIPNEWNINGSIFWAGIKKSLRCSKAVFMPNWVAFYGREMTHNLIFKVKWTTTGNEMKARFYFPRLRTFYIILDATFTQRKWCIVNQTICNNINHGMFIIRWCFQNYLPHFSVNIKIIYLMGKLFCRIVLLHENLVV